MQGAKLTKAEVLTYVWDSSVPSLWTSDPLDTIEIPDPQDFEMSYERESDRYFQTYGPFAEDVFVYGKITTFDHQIQHRLTKLALENEFFFDHTGDCLRVYYTTHDNEQWRLRINGVFFGSPARTTMKTLDKNVDTGLPSPESAITWIMGLTSETTLGAWPGRIILEQLDGSNWVNGWLPETGLR